MKNKKKTTKINCFIGIGSNLDNPSEQVRRAIIALNHLPQSKLIKVSGLYQTKPLGPPDQPDFINAVAAISTHLEPLLLLQELQSIEQKQGRKRDIRWGPRTLDLDLLLYGNTILNTDPLTLPHPGLYSRSFVLTPLAEIAPELVLPNGQVVADLEYLVSQQKSV